MTVIRASLAIAALACVPLLAGCIIIGGSGDADRVETRERGRVVEASNRDNSAAPASAESAAPERLPTAAELSSMFGLMRTMAANMPAGPNGRRAEIPADAMPSEAQLARMLEAMGRVQNSSELRDMAARQAGRPAGSMPTDAEMAVIGRVMGQMMGAMGEAGFGTGTTTQTLASIDDLKGRWSVSLRFDPTAPPSSTTMEIASLADGVATGSFYGSNFDAGRVVLDGNEVVFTATTADQSGQYIHSGRFRGGAIEGQTLSVGRNFLMPWTATKAD